MKGVKEKNLKFLWKLDTKALMLNLELFSKYTAHTSLWSYWGTFWQSGDFIYELMEYIPANQRSRQPSWISNRSKKMQLFFWILCGTFVIGLVILLKKLKMRQLQTDGETCVGNFSTTSEIFVRLSGLSYDRVRMF